MRMAIDQLLVELLNNIISCKSAQFLFHLRMKHNLQQKIPKLFPHMIRIIIINRLKHLVGFLDQIFADRLMGLLPVPRTSIRTAKNCHNLVEALKAAYAERIIAACRNIH
ncbi:hypothetical protein D3C81_1918020 [compost metagenome]